MQYAMTTIYRYLGMFSLYDNDLSLFRDVFTISALEGGGVEDLKKYLLDNSKPGKESFGFHYF